MKTVIIPSNGDAAFVEKCRIVLDVFPGETVNYIFLDIRPVPDDFNDMTTIARNRKDYSSFGSEFCEALTAFAAEDTQRSVVSDHIYGDSIAVFRNYIDAQDADLVIFDQDQWQHHTHFAQRNIFKMVMRCGCEVMYISAAADCLGKGSVHLVKRDVPKTAPKKETVSEVAGNAVGQGNAGMKRTSAPSSVKAQYSSVDNLLNQLESRVLQDQILKLHLGNVSRYFIKQSTLDKMLADTDRLLLWVKK